MKQIRLRYVLALAALAVISGCGGGGGTNTTKAPIVGTWGIRAYQLPGGVVQACPATLTDTDGSPLNCGSNTIIIFHSDGTYINQANENGTYSTNGSTLSFLSPQPGQLTFIISGTTMILKEATGTAVTLLKEN